MSGLATFEKLWKVWEIAHTNQGIEFKTKHFLLKKSLIAEWNYKPLLIIDSPLNKIKKWGNPRSF